MVASAYPVMEAYIRQGAAARGIDPEVAVEVARREALNVFDPSKPDYGGDDRSSFGLYQLHYKGLSDKMPNAGLGDEFTKTTGLDARDPSTWRQQVDFSLDWAAKHGWDAWMGAKAAGITGKMGIGANARPTGVSTGTDANAYSGVAAANASLASAFDPAIDPSLAPQPGRVLASGYTSDVPGGSSPVGYRSSGDQQRAPLPDAPVDDSSPTNTAVDFARATPEVPLQQTDPAVLSAPPAQAPPGGLAELFKVGDIGLASDKAIDPKTGLPLLARHRRSYG